MTQEFLLDLTLLSVAIATPLAAYLLRGQLRFLKQRPSISTYADLDELKTVLKKQMYGTLVFMPFAFAPFVLLLWALLIGGPVTLAVKIALSLYTIAFGAVGAFAKNIESRVRTLPVSTDHLRAEYERITCTWQNKALPTW